MDKKIVVVITILAFIAIAVITAVLLNKQNKEIIKACPMDVYVCADGTEVGRVLPDCYFTACPEPPPSSTQ